MKLSAGSWFIASVFTDRRKQRSSTIDAVCGQQIADPMPDSPCRANRTVGGDDREPRLVARHPERWPVPRTEAGRSSPFQC